MNYCLDARSATDHFPGIGRYTSSLAQAMASQLAQGERLALLVDTTAPSHWQLPPPGPRLAHLPAPVSPFSLSQQWRIPAILGRQKAALYHSPYYLMPYRPGRPTLLTVYDLIPLHFPGTVSLRARLLFRLTHLMAMRSASRIIAISHFTADDLARRYRLPAGKVSSIPLAASPEFHPQPAGVLAAIRARYRLPGHFLLYLGINKPHKNLPRLLQAYRWLREELGGQTPPLVIAGAWDERYPQLKQQAAAAELAGSVLFLGPLPDQDLPALYAAATLFLFPSLYEGFGLPLIEAMACGTAVACARSSSLPEVGGAAAFYFDPLDARQMVAAMARPLRDAALRREREQQGLAQAARFSWQRTAAETLAIYREVAAPGGQATLPWPMK